MNENDYKFNFYLIDKNQQIVFGFDDINEIREYALTLNMNIISYKKLMDFDINPNDINNWSNEIPNILKNI